MPRTQVPGSQVTDGTITTDDIADFEVRRNDVNIADAGDAVITKVIAGPGIVLGSTGADEGTGDVTLTADVDGRQRVTATLATKVPGGGTSYLTHDGQIPHSSVSIIVPEEYLLTEVTIHVNIPSTNIYTVNIYEISGVPSLVATLVTLGVGDLEAVASGLSVSLPTGEYGITLERVGGGGGGGGGGGSSNFDNTVVTVLVQKVVT